MIKSVQEIRENFNKQKQQIRDLQIILASTEFQASNLKGQMTSYEKVIEDIDLKIKEEEILLKSKRSEIWKEREDFCDDIDNFEEQYSWKKFMESLVEINQTNFTENVQENLEVMDLNNKIKELENNLQKLKKQISDYNVKKMEISAIERENSEVEQELELQTSKNNEILEEIKKCEEELKKRKCSVQPGNQRAISQPDIVLSNLNSQLDKELSEDAYTALLRCETELNIPKKSKYSDPQDSLFRFKTKSAK